jgi:hypothetical protein
MAVVYFPSLDHGDVLDVFLSDDEIGKATE